VIGFDYHVHSEWSWDADFGSMEKTCRRAVELGLHAVAFTEHADFEDFVIRRGGQLNVDGYLMALERCRAAFPELLIRSGVELGSPHRFPSQAAAVLGRHRFERRLGSVHNVPEGDRLVYVAAPGMLEPERAASTLRRHLLEVLALVESGQEFDIIAHLDYPKRFWPRQALPFDERACEAEYRAVLTAAAARGLALELNTSGGADQDRFCPGLSVLRWWREAGGRALSFGSDAHDPAVLGAGLELARELAEAAGFRPAADPFAYWYC
jgi:histidinol-phosphatase (PHP family)